MILLMNRQTNRAIGTMKAVCKEDPSNVESFLLLASLYESAHQSSQAIDVLFEAKELFPTAPEPYWELVRLYESQGKKQMAVSIVEELLDFLPEHSKAQVYLATYYVQRGQNFSLAERYLLSAREKLPGDQNVIHLLGQVYLMTGRIPNAYEELNLANKLQPNQPLIIEHLGDVYAVMGDSKAASDSYRKACYLYKHKDSQRFQILQQKLLELQQQSESSEK